MKYCGDNHISRSPKLYLNRVMKTLHTPWLNFSLAILPLYNAVLITPPTTATPTPKVAILFKKLDRPEAMISDHKSLTILFSLNTWESRIANIVVLPKMLRRFPDFNRHCAYFSIYTWNICMFMNIKIVKMQIRGTISLRKHNLELMLWLLLKVM